jgi:diguanylate cyclase (GGDEF)-like protein
MFIDLDSFKGINDTHGHDVGDGVLHMVGQRLLACVRAEDTVSRRSGDEFLMLMVEARDEANVTAFASRILDTVAQPCAIEGLNLSVKASMGIALYPEGGRSAEDLLKNADEAMYLAKDQKQGPVFYRDRRAA